MLCTQMCDTIYITNIDRLTISTQNKWILIFGFNMISITLLGWSNKLNISWHSNFLCDLLPSGKKTFSSPNTKFDSIIFYLSKKNGETRNFHLNRVHNFVLVVEMKNFFQELKQWNWKVQICNNSLNMRKNSVQFFLSRSTWLW